MYKVLVCEDEPPITRSVAKMIEKCNPNFKVTHLAYDGAEAVQILNHNPIDIIFTDMNMPLVNGAELMQYINLYFPNVTVVALSGYQQFDYVKSALINGAFDYLLKPASLKDVTDILARVEQKLLSNYNERVQQFFYNVSYLKKMISCLCETRRSARWDIWPPFAWAPSPRTSMTASLPWTSCGSRSTSPKSVSTTMKKMKLLSHAK